MYQCDSQMNYYMIHLLYLVEDYYFLIIVLLFLLQFELRNELTLIHCLNLENIFLWKLFFLFFHNKESNIL